MNRRGLLLGLGAALAAPAIVRAESLMQIAVLRETVTPRMYEFRRGVDGWEVVGEWQAAKVRYYRTIIDEFATVDVAVAA